jgi:N-methylhydantoinase B
MPGLPNRVRLETGAGQVALPNGKLGGRALAAGEVFVVESGGGGGFGVPWERDPALVASDVQAGYVSRQSALEEYGVVLGPSGRLDKAATDQQRAELAAAHRAAGPPADGNPRARFAVPAGPPPSGGTLPGPAAGGDA